MRQLALISFGFVALAGSAFGQVSTWSLGGASLQQFNGDGWNTYEVPTPNIGWSGLTNGIHLFSSGEGGRAFSISGADYQQGEGDAGLNRLHLFGTAELGFSNWNSDALRLPTDFQISFAHTGGQFTLYNAETGFTLLDTNGGFLGGVGSGVTPPLWGPLEPGEYGTGFQFVDGFGGNPSDAARIEWEVNILFSWTGMSQEDTLRFGSTIDMQITSVPAPASLAVLGIAGVVAGRRRR